MSRPNYIKFVEHLYRFNPEFTDWQIGNMLRTAYTLSGDEVISNQPSLSVWKAKLRKKGLKILDRRKNKGDSDGRSSANT